MMVKMAIALGLFFKGLQVTIYFSTWLFYHEYQNQKFASNMSKLKISCVITKIFLKPPP